MIAYNGYARIGIIDAGANAKVKTIPARITDKRIRTATRTWDKEGRRTSRYAWGAAVTLLAYWIKGEPEVVIAMGAAP